MPAEQVMIIALELQYAVETEEDSTDYAEVLINVHFNPKNRSN
ncbi:MULTISPECIES: hypothetical protein [Chryseobacterium]|uniref:Uncharacterized protein n=1 Tax=Chryseobacterium endophyticum TaxID=1854762 RepID=A0AAU6WTZ0_9FLAO|nr:hypothetical protein [uncultured Chryseobacterium sp.]